MPLNIRDEDTNRLAVELASQMRSTKNGRSEAGIAQ
jgi:hypothetical protein